MLSNEVDDRECPGERLTDHDVQVLPLPAAVWLKDRDDWRPGWLLGVEAFTDSDAFLVEFADSAEHELEEPQWVLGAELCERNSADSERRTA